MRELKIIVEADSDGNAKVEAVGFENNECLKATKTVEEALGKLQGRKLKAEGARLPQVGYGVKIGGK